MKKMFGAHIPSPSSEMSHDQSYWLGKQSVYKGVCIVQTHVYHSLVAHVQVSDVSDVYFLLCVSSECDHIGLVWAQWTGFALTSNFQYCTGQDWRTKISNRPLSFISLSHSNNQSELITKFYNSSKVDIGGNRAQELCESRGGHPGLPSLISLMVSVDVKQHWISVGGTCWHWLRACWDLTKLNHFGCSQT